ncbi:hypothetical protein ACO22_00453 [Paracoccidioides brasiliensis]|uniref:Prp 4 CRoW domain-containing protein n=1 Tax=Paracoccidioides brasiliensis TaxID=121759 RepID=A0A1D2JPK7_PARBR|nr:hypothetical protein ACO22_00453 [Paracoccidioides brasiliensis]
MHISSIVLFAGAVSAALVQPSHNMAAMALQKLQSRQLNLCKPIRRPYSCAKSCGEGYEECGSFPHCYNPTVGESCCTNGKYCPKGTFCTDSGCCPEGSSLADCNATESLTAPPTTSPTTPAGDDNDVSSSSSTTSDAFSLPTPTLPSFTLPGGSEATATEPFTNPTGAANKLGGQAVLIGAGLGLLAVL